MDQTLPPAFDPALEGNKILAAAKSPLFKKFSWTKSKTLFDAMRLAHLLVVFGKPDEAIAVCQTLGRIQFNGSFELWSAVEKTLALESRLLRQRGDSAAAQACLQRVRDAGFVEDRLEGSMLDRNGSIPAAIQEGDLKWERDARLSLAAELVFIIELGGSAQRPVAGLEQDYDANLAEIRRLVGLS